MQSQFPGANEVVGDEIWEPGVRFKVRSYNRHSHGDTPLFHGGTAKGNQNSGRLPERGAGICSEVTHWASEEQLVSLRHSERVRGAAVSCPLQRNGREESEDCPQKETKYCQMDGNDN